MTKEINIQNTNKETSVIKLDKYKSACSLTICVSHSLAPPTTMRPGKLTTTHSHSHDQDIWPFVSTIQTAATGRMAIRHYAGLFWDYLPIFLVESESRIRIFCSVISVPSVVKHPSSLLANTRQQIAPLRLKLLPIVGIEHIGLRKLLAPSEWFASVDQHAADG